MVEGVFAVARYFTTSLAFILEKSTFAGCGATVDVFAVVVVTGGCTWPGGKGYQGYIHCGG